MIVPADEAPMTNGKPYDERQLAGWGAAMVAKSSLLMSRDASCVLTRSQRGTRQDPCPSSHLPRRGTRRIAVFEGCGRTPSTLRGGARIRQAQSGSRL